MWKIRTCNESDLNYSQVCFSCHSLIHCPHNLEPTFLNKWTSYIEITSLKSHHSLFETHGRWWRKADKVTHSWKPCVSCRYCKVEIILNYHIELTWHLNICANICIKTRHQFRFSTIFYLPFLCHSSTERTEYFSNTT